MSRNERDLRSTSKFLSLVLRHQPEAIGIELDDSGWTDIDGLIEAMCRSGKHITRDQLEQVVATNDKQRFVISEEGKQIRANQGHSVEVDLGYEAASPPEILLHGTPSTAVEAIRREGLKKMKRHHVHLHADSTTAESVGARRGKPVILRIRAQEMANAGFVFYVSANQVWLTDHVPPNFIDFP